MEPIATIRTLSKILKEGRLRKAARYMYERVLFRIYRLLPHNGVNVVDEVWDYLIVLTACRYDKFKELNTIPGKLENRISKESRTITWAKKNFDKYYENVVYVSANPRISNIEFSGFRGTDHFFRVVSVWDFGWDKELNTVPPREVTKAALGARDRYPDKRMIIHYMQPHAPWIGETRLSGKELGLSHSSAIEWYNKSAEIGLGLWGIWEKVEDLGISLELVRRAYRDNLRLVLDEVETLVGELHGKIVISADHGECLGEKLLVEHPSGIHVRELVEVPWLIIQKPRKTFVEKSEMNVIEDPNR